MVKSNVKIKSISLRPKSKMATQAQKLKSLSTDEKFDYIITELSEMKKDIKGIKEDIVVIKDTISKIKIVIPVPIENAELLQKLQAKVKKK